MTYHLICAGSVGDLNLKVNQYLSEGWKLYGSPAVSQSGDGNTSTIDLTYIQAVIHE